MPKVKLLKQKHETFVLVFGRQMFEFKGDEEVTVPVAVALELKKKKDNLGKDLFKVQIDENIIIPEHKTEIAQQPSVKPKEELQNLPGNLIQTRFEGWPLSPL